MPLSKIQGIEGQVTPNLGRRNMVINGAAEVYQRGASATAHNSYSVDRWQLKNTSGATCTHQQATDSPAPFKNSVRYSAGGTSCTAAQLAGIAQRMEGTYTLPLGWGTSAAKPCTLSFWVKSSVTGTYAVSTRNNDTDSSFVNTYTINTANTWEHKTVTFSAQTAGTWLNTTGIGVRLWFDLGSGDNFNADATGQWRSSANYLTVSNQADVVGTSGAFWYLTGVQLEVGNTSTDFEHRSVGEELQLCKRYFHTYGGTNAFEHLPFLGQGNSSSINFNHELPVEMRTTPTLSQSGDWRVNGGYLGTYYTLSSVALDNLSSKLIRGSATTSGAIGGAIGRVIAYNDLNARWSYSAEL